MNSFTVTKLDILDLLKEHNKVTSMFSWYEDEHNDLTYNIELFIGSPNKMIVTNNKQ